MGKHERKQIEEAEKIIVKILNSRNFNNEDKTNHWFRHVLEIAKNIKRDFSNIKKAHHLGNRYDNTGDIMIVSNDKKYLIEIKMSDTKEGIGTKANISQDALTLNHLFKGNVKNWSVFRNQYKHDKWVNNYLDQYKNYPKDILKINIPSLQKEEKARYLRKIKKSSKLAAHILTLIHERDKKEKLMYLNYLSKQKQNEEIIKKFFILILLGIHKQQILEQLMGNNIFFEKVKDLFVYYGNSFKNRIIVRKENSGEKIRKILKDFLNFEIIFPKRVGYCKIVGLKGKSQQPLLQIVFHWKNIAQGIKTPCLNIFDLTKNHGFN